MTDARWLKRPGITRIILNNSNPPANKYTGLLVRIDSIVECGWSEKDDLTLDVYKIRIHNEDLKIVQNRYNCQHQEFWVHSTDLVFDPVTRGIFYSYLSNLATTQDLASRKFSARAGAIPTYD